VTHLELIVMTDPKPPAVPDELSPEQVRSLLRAAPRPEPPNAEDMVSAVRARLAAEEASASAPTADAPAPPISLDAERQTRRGWKAWVPELAVVAAAAAAIVVAVTLADDMQPGGQTGTQAAGVSGVSDAVVVELSAGVTAEAVREAAAANGMRELPANADGQVVIEGDFRQAKRFLVALRVAAARTGGEVRGFIPDAAHLRFVVDVVTVAP